MISYEAFTNYYGGINTAELAEEYANRETMPEWKAMFLQLAEELRSGIRYQKFINANGQLAFRRVSV